MTDLLLPILISGAPMTRGCARGLAIVAVSGARVASAALPTKSDRAAATRSISPA